MEAKLNQLCLDLKRNNRVSTIDQARNLGVEKNLDLNLQRHFKATTVCLLQGFYFVTLEIIYKYKNKLGECNC